MFVPSEIRIVLLQWSLGTFNSECKKKLKTTYLVTTFIYSFFFLKIIYLFTFILQIYYFFNRKLFFLFFL